MGKDVFASNLEGMCASVIQCALFWAKGNFTPGSRETSAPNYLEELELVAQHKITFSDSYIG